MELSFQKENSIFHFPIFSAIWETVQDLAGADFYDNLYLCVEPLNFEAPDIKFVSNRNKKGRRLCYSSLGNQNRRH